jgi:DNA-binding ferritin-like protein
VAVDKKLLGDAIAQVSDTCAAASGDVHTCHLNMRGAEFDTLHKEVLKTYYEQLDEDYDSLAEFAGCYGHSSANKNEAATRIGWTSFNGEVDRATAINVSNEVLEAVLIAMHKLFGALNKIEDCPIAVGISNWLQGRIEYWAKEVYYFNARRA